MLLFSRGLGMQPRAMGRYKHSVHCGVLASFHRGGRPAHYWNLALVPFSRFKHSDTSGTFMFEFARDLMMLRKESCVYV